VAELFYYVLYAYLVDWLRFYFYFFCEYDCMCVLVDDVATFVSTQDPGIESTEG
jgi:hypothetical protein